MYKTNTYPQFRYFKVKVNKKTSIVVMVKDIDSHTAKITLVSREFTITDATPRTGPFYKLVTGFDKGSQATFYKFHNGDFTQ